MGTGKGRRGRGASSVASPTSPSPVVPHRDPPQRREADGGWPARVKVLTLSTLGYPDRDEGGRAIALSEEDIRKSGFRVKDLVAVLGGPSRLIAGRVTCSPSAALRPGSVGLESTSVSSLDCKDGTRVRIRRLNDTSIAIYHAKSLTLALERGGPARLQEPQDYLDGFSASRRALLNRAVSYSAMGCHTREGDLLSVSFEGLQHSFRVSQLSPSRLGQETGKPEMDGCSDVVEPFAALSVDDKHDSSAMMPPWVTPEYRHGIDVQTPSSTPVHTPYRSQVSRDVVVGHGTPATEITSAPPPESGKGDSNASTSGASPRQRLEAFYLEHNPEKLGDVPGILEKYAGRESELFAKLERKYGPGSVRAAASGGEDGRQRKAETHGDTCSPVPLMHSLRPGSREHGTGTPAQSHISKPQPGNMGQITPGASEKPGVRDWGSNEALWFITTETSIELTASCVRSTQPNSRLEQPTFADEQLEGFRRGSANSVRAGSGDDWSSVGGLSAQIQQLKEAIQLPLNSPEVLRRYGVRPPRGVLLYGPPGTGKTTLARAAATACRCHVIVVNGSELMSRFVGESEAALRRTFTEASRMAPCLIVFDEMDTLCPRRDQTSSEGQRRVVSTVLALLDGVDARERVVVIGCTNRPQALDPALRRPGRLDSEIEIGVPDEASRAEILAVLLRRVPHSLEGSGVSAVGIKEIASRTHGFVGADLQLLLKEAALQALRRTRRKFDGSCGEEDGTGVDRAPPTPTPRDKGSSQRQEDLPVITIGDFRSALHLVSPSGLREVAVEVPSVRWTDIGGMDGVKQSLREVVEWPLRHPEAFKRMGMSPPRGVLLYGPPGCSKTLMARALATESGMNFLAVKGPELLSKWLGESERAMQGLFKRARAAAPTIIFFDEVDALASKRGAGEGGANATERVLTQLLTELDGIQPLKRVVVVAATNRPDVIDPALLRPGRLDRLVYVPPPDTPSRREILRLSLAKIPAAAEINREELARRTEGFSGAEVVAMCREASINALEEDLSATEVRHAHLLGALEQMRAQITPEVLASYARFHGGSH